MGMSVLYLCNQKQCLKCSYPECKHTSNIRCAKNFKPEANDFWELTYVEQEVEPDAQTPSECSDVQNSE